MVGKYIYGEQMIFHRGKLHNYLVMYLDLSEKGSFKVFMIK